MPVVAPAAEPASTPDPKELWDSYPLAPGGGRAAPDPAPTPTPTPTASATPTASPERTPAAEADGGTSTAIVVAGALVTFAIGIGAGELWRRRRRAASPVPPRYVSGPRTASREPAPQPTGPPRPRRAATPARRRQAPAAAKPPGAPAEARAAAQAGPRRPVREPEPAGVWLEPEPPAPVPTRRFASTWPADAGERWTCEIDWKAGYRASSFRAMAGPPGATKRRAFGESSALRWTLMADPDPPTPELVACVRELSDALEAAGWQEVGRGRRWYALRFVWTHTEEPRPLEPLTRKAKHV